MVKRLPTPPPSSTLELLDQERSSNMQCDSLVQATAVLSTNFEQTFRSIVDYSSQNKFHDLIRVAEQADFSGYGESNNLTRLFILTPLVLAYLIVDDIPPAKHALLRMPDSLKSIPLSVYLRNLSAACWQRAYEQVYANATDLNGLLAQADFFDKDLANTLTHLVASFTNSFRRRTADLLLEAYAAVPLSLATVYLGISKEEALSVAQREGWRYDAVSDTLSVVSKSKAKTTGLTQVDTPLSTFHYVVDSVSQLES